MEDPRVLAMASSSSSSLCSSSKRAREPTNGTETTTVGWCSVDGFISDLNKCRDYHRRHKVCQVHSKKPTVMIGGREQRFCQQCSRFHLLVEFDEAKRSCRKRLDGHNRRRRKLQLEPFTISSESLLSNHQGQVFVAIQCSTVISHSYRLSMWTGGVKTDDDTKVYIRHQDNNPVLVLQNHPAREVTLGYRFNVIASSQDNELPWVIIQASGKGLDHSITLAQLLVATGLQYNNGLSERYQSPGMKDEPMDSVLGPDTSEPELHSQWVFHMQTKNGSEHVSPDSPRTFPFS